MALTGGDKTFKQHTGQGVLAAVPFGVPLRAEGKKLEKLFQLLTDYLRKQQDNAGYIEVNTPDVMDRELWKISGHWQNYQQHMFTTGGD